MILFDYLQNLLLCIYFKYASKGVVGCWINYVVLGDVEIEKGDENSDNGCWINEVILSEEEIEKGDEISDNDDNSLSSGAVGCWFNGTILGEEEKEIDDENFDGNDNRFIWKGWIWFAFIGMLYWDVVLTIH